MRKIAANYIYLPGYTLVKNGYLVMEEGGVVMDVVDTGGVIREFHGLEFYGGMIVDGSIMNHHIQGGGTGIIPFLDDFYANHPTGQKGIAILKGADLAHLSFLPETRVEAVR